MFPIHRKDSCVFNNFFFYIILYFKTVCLLYVAFISFFLLSCIHLNFTENYNDSLLARLVPVYTIIIILPLPRNFLHLHNIFFSPFYSSCRHSKAPCNIRRCNSARHPLILFTLSNYNILASLSSFAPINYTLPSFPLNFFFCIVSYLFFPLFRTYWFKRTHTLKAF